MQRVQESIKQAAQSAFDELDAEYAKVGTPAGPTDSHAPATPGASLGAGLSSLLDSSGLGAGLGLERAADALKGLTPEHPFFSSRPDAPPATPLTSLEHESAALREQVSRLEAQLLASREGAKSPEGDTSGRDRSVEASAAAEQARDQALSDHAAMAADLEATRAELAAAREEAGELGAEHAREVKALMGVRDALTIELRAAKEMCASRSDVGDSEVQAEAERRAAEAESREDDLRAKLARADADAATWREAAAAESARLKARAEIAEARLAAAEGMAAAAAVAAEAEAAAAAEREAGAGAEAAEEEAEEEEEEEAELVSLRAMVAGYEEHTIALREQLAAVQAIGHRSCRDQTLISLCMAP